jgi:GNAT superfamily N-acetyltransferase
VQLASESSFHIRRTAADSAEVAAILRELPEWFGIEEATLGYIAAAERLPNYFAFDQTTGDVLGVLLTEQRFPSSVEIHLMAVKPRWHRSGVGRQLLAHVEADLRSAGVRLLSVKTLGPSQPDPGYDRTRLFYESVGFLPVEEFHELWQGTPCLVMVKMI